MKKRKRKQMVVWEVSLADAADAKPENISHGGISVYQLPTKHICHIESVSGWGLTPTEEQAAKALGLEAGLTRPIVKGCIRASEKVASEGVYRGLMEGEEPTP